jgi:hypothetical protein
VGVAAQLVVPFVALLSSSTTSTRIQRGRRYRIVVRFRPPLEGERSAWVESVIRDYPGASQVTVTPRGGSTLLGWIYRATRTHVVEPNLTLFRVGDADGVLDTIYEAGEVQT